MPPSTHALRWSPVVAVALLLGLGTTSPAQTTFAYTGATQAYVVPPGVTSLRIDARGAQGGSTSLSCAIPGGKGARIVGTVAVTPGETLTILVGGQGLSSTLGADGSGGGGSFVVRAGNVPLIVAGGGGGSTNDTGTCGPTAAGIGGTTSNAGTASADGSAAGGSGGNGGAFNAVTQGGAGGGFTTDGAGGTGGGQAFVNGGAGGASGPNRTAGAFGGGGASGSPGGNGGGGGGYSGGGAGSASNAAFVGGGGGGSFNAGANPLNTADFQTGNGQVIIDPVQVATTLVVNSNDDIDDGACTTGHCSLREAIIAANATTSVDETINFNIPGPGTHTIQLLSPLPRIRDTTFLDGLSQPANGGPAASCTTGPLLIEIVGPPNQTGTYFGVTLEDAGSNGSTIRGLAVNGFHGTDGDFFVTGIMLQTTSNSVVQCNFVGTNAAGTAVANGGNQLGIRANGGSGNLIGTNGDGTNDANERNVVGGNSIGVYFDATTANKVAGNVIGTDVSGNSAIPNANGVGMNFGANGNIIGFDGTGTAATEGNLIRFNSGPGIFVGTADSTGNRISANRIYGNAGLGIDLATNLNGDGVTANDTGDADTGGNNYQNFPVITAANTNGVNNTVIAYDLDFTFGSYLVEFFSSPTCAGTHGQGQVYLGSTTLIGPGGASSGLPFPTVPNQVLTATATKLTGSGGAVGDTSEFSQCVVIQGPPALSNVATTPNPSPVSSSIALTGTATDPNPGDTLTLTVSWGDGSPNTVVTVSNGTPFSQPHTYATVGVFTITVTVSDGGLTSTQTLTQTVLARPSMTKTFTPNDIPLNGTSTLTFVIANTNTTTALTGVQFSDPFPAGLQVAAAPSASVTGCGSPTFVPTPGATTLTFSGGTVAASSTCTVTVAVTATTPGAKTNTSGAVSSTNASTGNAPTGVLTVRGADLSITKTDNRVSAIAGQSVTYVIEATNAGPDTVFGAIVNDSFPSTLTCSWTCSEAAGGACTQPSGTGSIIGSVNLPANASVTYTATCQVAATATGSIENTATITAPVSTPDPNTQNNSAKDIDTVLRPSLSLIKTSSATSFAQAGDVLPFTLVATNDGSLLLTTVAITDPLIGALTCTSNGVPATGQPVALDPGEALTCTGTYVVTGADVVAGFVTNTASAQGAYDDATGIGNLQVAQAEALVTVTVTDTVTVPGIAPGITAPRVAFTTCSLELQQDWTPRYTKLQFDVWNEDEVKFTGAFECSDSWHETDFGASFDSAQQNFTVGVLGTFGARYRVQAVTSTQCPEARATGLLGVQSMLAGPNAKAIGTALTGAGKFTGSIRWDPSGAVPEGGIR